MPITLEEYAKGLQIKNEQTQSKLGSDTESQIQERKSVSPKRTSPTWDQIVNSKRFQAHDDTTKEYVRNRYFNDFIAPNVPKDRLDSVRASFDADTKGSWNSPTIGDYGKQLVSSGIEALGTIPQMLGEGAAYIANKATGKEEYSGFNPLEPMSRSIRRSMTAGGKRAAADSATGDVMDPSTWEMPKTKSGVAMSFLQGLGSLSTWLIPGGAALKAAKLYEAGDLAGAARAAKIATAAGGITGGLSTGGDAAGDARENVSNAISGMSHEQLMKEVPIYADEFRKSGDERIARDAVVNRAGLYSGILAGTVGVSEGIIGGGLLGRIARNKGIPGLSDITSPVGRVLAGAAVSSPVEGVQEALEKSASNAGENIATGRKITDDLTRNTFPEALGGAMVGSAVGGAGGAAASQRQTAPKPDTVTDNKKPVPASQESNKDNIIEEVNKLFAGEDSSVAGTSPQAQKKPSSNIDGLKYITDGPATQEEALSLIHKAAVDADYTRALEQRKKQLESDIEASYQAKLAQAEADKNQLLEQKIRESIALEQAPTAMQIAFQRAKEGKKAEPRIQPVRPKPSYQQETKPASSTFTPTHELSDGTLVVRYKEDGVAQAGVWQDERGDIIEDNYAVQIPSNPAATVVPESKKQNESHVVQQQEAPKQPTENIAVQPESDRVLSKKGKPFKTIAEAELFAKTNRLNNHVPVNSGLPDGGFALIKSPAIVSQETNGDNSSDTTNNAEVSTSQDYANNGLIVSKNGTPFKTEKEARLFAKLNKHKKHEPIAVDGGFALKIKDVEVQNRKTVKKDISVDPNKDSILAAIGKLGGINVEDAKLNGIDPAVWSRKGGAVSGVFGRPWIRANGGDTFDGMAERLSQYGYFPSGVAYGANALLDMVTTELGGRKVYTQNGYAAAAERAYQDRLSDQEEAYAQDIANDDQIAEWISENADEIMASEEIHADELSDIPGFGPADSANEQMSYSTEEDLDAIFGKESRAKEATAGANAEKEGPGSKGGAETSSSQDIFGQDTRKEQAIADAVRNKDEKRNRTDLGEIPSAGIGNDLFSNGGKLEPDLFDQSVKNNRVSEEKGQTQQANSEAIPEAITKMADAVAKLADKVDAMGEEDAKKPNSEAEAKAESATQSMVQSHDDLMKRLDDGAVTAAEFKAAFDAIVENRDAILADLGKLTKHELLDRLDGISAQRYKNEKKARAVDSAYDGMIRDFLAPTSTGGMFSYSHVTGDRFGGVIAAVRARVEKTTDDDIRRHAAGVIDSIAEREQKIQEIDARLADPQTADDFIGFIRMKLAENEGMTYGEARMMLTPEQRAKFDELVATETRGKRVDSNEDARTRVMAAGATTGAKIIETTHTRDGYDLFVVQSEERVDRDVYQQWLEAAKKMGGWYSKFRGNGAVPGFQFKSREAAEAFQKYVSGGDAEAVQEQAKVRRDAFADDRSQSAVERLNDMADRLDEQADESLGREHKANTARRAQFAARSEAAARSQKAMAATMRNIAAAIKSGSAKFLDRVRQKSQVEMLQGFVNVAHGDMLREKYPTYSERERHSGEKPTTEAADYVKFPTYTAYRSDLANIGRALLGTEGTKKLGQRIMKVADDVTDAYLEFAKDNLHKVSRFTKASGGLAIFKSKADAEAAIARSGFNGDAIVLPVKRGENVIIMSPSSAMKHGIWQGDGDKRITLNAEIGQEIVEKLGKINRNRSVISVPWQFESAYDKRKRLAGIGIETPAELRAALREFIALREAPKEADKIKEMERAMIGRRNDGLDFFPTPANIADEMVAAADIQEGMSVLEPSAGMGHIAERIREAGVDPDVVELSGTRRELLEAKGFNLVGNDFMETEGSYDRIIMNPPFGDRRDAEHVRHAYDLLKPGGRLVAIVGEGVFFGSDKKAQEFRDWLEQVGASDEKLDEGTFLDPSLPVTTGVNARLVVIDRPLTPAVLAVSSGENLGPLSIDVANRTVGRVLVDKGWNVSLNVWPTFDSIPEKTKEAIAKYGEDTKVKGVVHDGVLHLVADAHKSEADLESTILHEIKGHIGPRRLYGKNVTSKLNDLYIAIGGIKGMRKIAAKRGITKDLSWYAEKVGKSDFDNRTRVHIMMEEMLAHIAQEPKFSDRVKAIVGAIRSWMRDHRFAKLAEYGETDLLHILSQGEKSLKISGNDGGPSVLMAANDGKDWYYSPLKKAVDEAKQSSMPAQQWKLWIKSNAPKLGVKTDEIAWSGIEEYLDLRGNEKVTKYELSQFLDDNGVNVNDVIKSGPRKRTQKEIERDAYEQFDSDFMDKNNEGWRDWLDYSIREEKRNAWDDPEHIAWKHLNKTRDQYIDDEYGNTGDAEKAFSEDFYDLEYEQIFSGLELDNMKGEAWDQSRREYIDAQEAEESDPYNNEGDAKYGKYVLPGGDNYRELLLTIPEKQSPDRGPKGWGTTNGGTHDSANFIGGHFDEPNILAHVRFNERIDAEGKRVLFIEEIQSDWGQKGKKEGFAKKVRSLREIDAELSDINRKRSEMIDEAAALPDSRMEDFNRINVEIKRLGERMKELNREWDEAQSNARIPSAPFVTDTKAWTGLAIKRMMAYAAENGFDRIAWTTGEQQAERYDLSKQIDKIQWTKLNGDNFDDGKTRYQIQVVKNGRLAPVFGGQRIKFVTANELEDYIGKDAAKKIVDSDSFDGELEGDNLKVGGEGMKAFYNKIVPQVANDILKKLGGGKVTVIRVDTGVSNIGGYDTLGFDISKVQIKRDPLGNWFVQKGTDSEDKYWNGYNFVKYEGETRLFKSEEEARISVMSTGQLGFDITPAMREKAAQGLPLFSRFGEQGSGLPKETIENIIEPIRKKWSGVDIRVVQSESDLPGHERRLRSALDNYYSAQDAYMRNMNDNNFDMVRKARNAVDAIQQGSAEGYHAGGNVIYVVADNIQTESRLMQVLAHEAVGHYSMEDMLRGEFDQVLKHVKLMENSGNKAAKEAAAIVDRTQPGLSDIKRSKEVIAVLAERGVHNSLMNRIKAAIQNFLRAIGINIELNDADLAMLIRAAETRLSDRASMAESRAIGAFSRSNKPGPRIYTAKTINIDGVTRQTTNSKGRPIAETEEGLRNFWRWFGDSKVVDSEGRPLVVYHGTVSTGIESFLPAGGREGDWQRALDHFKSAKQNNDRYGYMDFRNGSFFSPDYEYAGNYTRENTGVMYIAYIKAENPIYFDQITRKATGTDKNKTPDAIILHEGRNINEVSVIDPTQVKSAIGNRGTFDINDPNILFSRREIGWTAPEISKLDTFLYEIQDKHIDTKRVIQAIVKQAGKIADQWNTYIQEALYHNRAAKRIEDFLTDELEPLTVEMRKSGVTQAQLNEYLHARHAEERNRVMQERNPDRADNTDLSRMSNEKAAEILKAADPKIKELASRVDAIIARSRQMLVEYGLEKQETVDAWARQYEHYVPLKREGFDDVVRGNGTGAGFSVRGKSSQEALGSHRDVDNIFANIAMQREKAIVRGEKNRVALSLLGLAKLNPNKDFWKLDKPSQLTQINPESGLEEVVPGDMADYAVPKVRHIGADGTVQERIDPNYKGRNNVIMARVNGEDRAIIFNEQNPRAMRMVEALKNLDADQIGEIIGSIGKVTRYFASINTQYNPVFGIVNLIRDIQTAILNLSSTPLKGKKAAVMKEAWGALKGIYKDARAVRNGRHPSSPYAELWEEFQRTGGPTGYRDMFRTAKDRAEAIEHMLDPSWWQKTKLGKTITVNGILAKPEQFIFDKVGRHVFRWLSDYNTTMENAVRLAAYKVAKENGMSKERAAFLAKNLTVNFNKKGRLATQAGALYAFFNASVQGSARIAETLTEGAKPGEVFGKAGKAIIYGGITLGAMQALALLMAGFDEDEPPKFIRERALVIPTGWTGAGPDKGYISIPMPLGFHVLPNIGRTLIEAAVYGKPIDRTIDLLLTTLEAFNPVGGGASFAQTIAPTISDPVVALAENKDWTGKNIYREDFNKLNPTPGFERTKDNASIISKGMAYGINIATGGTDYTPGRYSPTPDQIDYLIGQITGGVGRESLKAITTAESLMTGEELPTYKIPLVGRLVGNASGKAGIRDKFYNNLRELNMHDDEIKGRIENKEPVNDYLRKHPEAKLLNTANGVEKKVRELQKLRRKLMEKGEYDRAKSLEVQTNRLMERFNSQVEQTKAMQPAKLSSTTQ